MMERSFNNFSSEGQQADRLTHAPLFAGINGFGVASDWMGWEQPFHCEIDPFCQKIIQYYWPNSKSYYDIRKTDFTIWRGKIDILTGGFPCQPFSNAGSRKGKEDERHLWPEMLRAVREIKPRYIVGENVSGILSWSKGMVFEEIQNDLEDEGYKVQSVLLPAISIGADHIRERIWFVAYSSSLGRKDVQSNIGSSSNKTIDIKRYREKAKWWQKEADVLDTSCNTFLRFQEMHGKPPIFNVDDGLPFKLDGITVPKWLEKSNQGAGNAIVPGMAYQIFKALMEAESKGREKKIIKTDLEHESMSKTGT
jgi:DNA (cytosine-5)-methyltransferase 1